MYIDPEELNRFFWNMTVVDALVASFGRHNGNWGFLSDNATGKWSIAPVFDCGSSLYPQADENVRKKIMSDRNELEVRLYNRSLSVFRINNEKLLGTGPKRQPRTTRKTKNKPAPLAKPT